jgi:peptide maturation system acyl carrier-related protein
MINGILNVDIKLMEIFNKVTGLNFACMEESAKDFNLLGRNLKIRSCDLLNLFFEIEKSFGISIPQEDILEDRFNTFNNISKVVKYRLSK